jgi:hypothetical protein
VVQQGRILAAERRQGKEKVHAGQQPGGLA